jgi:DNA invertase Pin-like site-specific DNA recombinase
MKSFMTLVSKTELIKLQKTLGTDEAIGKKLKVCRQAIHYYRTKYGIKSNWAGNPERNRQIISLYKSGISGTQIAKKVGLSVSMTYRIIGEQQAFCKGDIDGSQG